MPHQCTNCGRTFADGSKEMLSGCPDCGGNKFQFRPAGVGEFPPADGESSSPEDTPETDRLDRGALTDAAAKAGAAVRDRFSSNTSNDSNADDTIGADEAASGSPDPDDAPSSSRTEWPDPTVSAADDEDASSPEDDAGLDAIDQPTTESGDPTDAADAADVTDGADAADAADVTDGADAADAVEHENRAQADARSDVVSRDELSAAARDVPASTNATDSQGQSTSEDQSRTQEPSEESGAERPSDVDGTVVEPTSEDRPDLDDLREELNDQFESIRIVNPGQYELNLMELYDRDEYIISLQEDGRYVIEVPDTWRDEE